MGIRIHFEKQLHKDSTDTVLEKLWGMLMLASGDDVSNACITKAV